MLTRVDYAGEVFLIGGGGGSPQDNPGGYGGPVSVIAANYNEGKATMLSINITVSYTNPSGNISEKFTANYVLNGVHSIAELVTKYGDTPLSELISKFGGENANG